MAILHNQPGFYAESVSFKSQQGDQSSYRAVPEGKTFWLQTVRALNGETYSREIEIKIVDPDGITYAVLANQSVRKNRACFWSGSIKLPAGWRVYAQYYGLAGGATCNWQLTARIDSFDPDMV